MTLFEWLKELVYTGNITSGATPVVIFVVFGCVIITMTIGFIFKFLLKLMD